MGQHFTCVTDAVQKIRGYLQFYNIHRTFAPELSLARRI
jgi:hypothetical protein